jgi:hypothetical protein
LKAIDSTWAMSAKLAEWLIGIHLLREYGSGHSFLNLLDLTTVNSYIILLCCSSKTDHRKCRLALVQNLLEVNARDPHPQSTPRGRPNLQASQMTPPLKPNTMSTGLLQDHICSDVCVQPRTNQVSVCLMQRQPVCSPVF